MVKEENLKERKKHYYLELFLAFFRVGIFGYGGGPSSIPLVHNEVVGKYKWMENEEFGDILALANTLPGPIATKMAGYIGYRISGIVGMILALIATVIPTIILMVVLLTFLSTFQNKPWVAGMTNGVVPIVGVMLAKMTYDFLIKSKEGLGWLNSIFLAVVSIIMIKFLHINPAFIIAALILFALIKPTAKAKRNIKPSKKQEVDT